MCIVVQGRTIVFEGTLEQCLEFTRTNGGDILEHHASGIWVVA